MASDKGLDPLGEREEFKELLSDLEKEYPPKKEMPPAPLKK